MSIVTIEFWLMVLLAALGCRLSKTARTQQILLLLFSGMIYITWGIIPFLILLSYSIVSYFFIKAISSTMHRNKKKRLLMLHIIISLLLLFAFKYFNFFSANLEKILNITSNFRLLILPTGISFYILSSIGFAIDVYKKNNIIEFDFVKTALFLSYFPKVICGPIERADSFLDKIESPHKICKKDVFEAFQIIMWGMWKKYVIADRLGAGVDVVFAHVERFDHVSLMLAALGYSVQILCDFSGYTDIAVGISKLMGIELVRNFDLPYCAKSPSEFWRRWHISLSSWFRDYVYIPLGGSRCSKARQYFNIFVTMLISGLWHGANWTFVIWGAFHGLAQCIQRLSGWKTEGNRGKERRFQDKVSDLIKVIVTFLLISILWIFFRADSLQDAVRFVYGMISLQGGIRYMYVYTPVYTLMIVIASIVIYTRNDGHFKYPILDADKTSHIIILTAEVLLFFALAYFGDTSFIYNRF